MRKQNGYGGISKLSGNRRRAYVARVTDTYTDEGVQVYKVLGYFATKAEAEIALAEYNKNRYDIDRRKITFSELYTEWSESHYKNIGESAINGYKTAYNHCKNLYNMRFVDIRAVHLQRVIDEDCQTYSIRKSVRVLLNVLYKYAYDNDIVEKKYNETVKIGKPVKVHDKQPFSSEEIQTLWENVDKIRGVDTVLILIYTSCRVNEILKEIEDANLDERWIKTGSKTTSGKGRIVPISKKIIDLVKNRYNPQTKRLIEMDGKPVTYYEYKRYIFEPALQQLGINHTPHECRHSRSNTTWKHN